MEDLASVPRPASEPPWQERIVAFIEVLLCSDFPTQLAIGSALMAAGYHPVDAQGRLDIGYIAALELTDALVLLALIMVFLRAHGERPRQLFLGSRPVGVELLLGALLVFVAFAIVAVVMTLVQQLAPWLRSPDNPLLDLIQSPKAAWIFALIVVVAGGIREEVQRAFLLHRFEQSLGGKLVGVTVISLAFAAGHSAQGRDAIVVTGALGVFWAVVYLRRRSVIGPVVSHSGFNLLQIVAQLARPG